MKHPLKHLLKSLMHVKAEIKNDNDYDDVHTMTRTILLHYVSIIENYLMIHRFSNGLFKKCAGYNYRICYLL